MRPRYREQLWPPMKTLEVLLMNVSVFGDQNIVLLYVLSCWKIKQFLFLDPLLLVLGRKRVAFVLEKVNIYLKNLGPKKVSSSITWDGTLVSVEATELSSSQIFFFSFFFFLIFISKHLLRMSLTFARVKQLGLLWYLTPSRRYCGLFYLELTWILDPYKFPTQNLMVSTDLVSYFFVFVS